MKWIELGVSSPQKPCERSSHGISLLPNGSLLLYGGEHVARTPIAEEADKVWIFDSTWTCQACINPPPPRIAHAQAVIGTDLYIFGGRAGITMQEQALDDVWKLDTTSWTWTPVSTTNTPCARSFHRMIAVEEKLYVFGGCGVQGRLNDLHCLDTSTGVWTDLGTSLLRGRGGPNLVHYQDQIVIVAGFAGEETNDGHAFDLHKAAWEPQLLTQLNDLRPRSVCVAHATASHIYLFGGEVDPSSLGHEGAGGFANDVVQISPDGVTTHAPTDASPTTRGWADGDGNDKALYVFGGLTGDDSNPVRLNDLWKLEL